MHAVRTGEGQLVRTSLYESAIAGMAEWGFHFLNAPAGEPQRPRPGHASPYTPPPYAFYATKDGYIALSSGRQIGTLSRILGIDDLSQDDRFATYWARYDNRAEFTVILEEALAAKTTAEWLELIEAEDMFAAPVNSMGEAFSDPAVAHTEMVVELDTPVGPSSSVCPTSSIPPRPACAHLRRCTASTRMKFSARRASAMPRSPNYVKHRRFDGQDTGIESGSITTVPVPMLVVTPSWFSTHTSTCTRVGADASMPVSTSRTIPCAMRVAPTGSGARYSARKSLTQLRRPTQLVSTCDISVAFSAPCTMTVGKPRLRR